MADESESRTRTANPCCIKIWEKFLTVKESRKTWRRIAKSAEPKVAKLEEEREAHRARADLAEEAKEKEAKARVGLEEKVVILTSTIDFLQQNKVSGDQDGGGEVILLRTRVSELEKEIDLERKRIEAEKIKAEEACKVEKEARLNEAAIKTGLEDSLLNLKSEIASLKESKNSIDQDECIKKDQIQVREWETEIGMLSELLEKERRNGDLEMKKVLEEKQKIEEALKNEAEARSKESSIIADLEKENLDLKSLIASSSEGRSSKLSNEEIVLLETRVSDAEAEKNQLKKQLDQEKKRADSLKKKASPKMKKAEEAWRIEAEATKASLENEILDLKSQIAVLQEQVNSSNQERSSKLILVQTRLSESEVENTQLKELLDQEKRRVDLERIKGEEACRVEAEARLKETAIRAGLEKEILDLKSQITLLMEQTDSGKIDSQIDLHQTRVLEAELESNRLKELLEEEKRIVELQRKKAEEAWRIETEATKASLENEIFDLKSQIAVLQEQVNSSNQERSSKVILVQTRLSEAEVENTQLKELLDQEKRRVVLEKIKGEEACRVEAEARLKETAIRAGLEKEILDLKSQITLLLEQTDLGKIDSQIDLLQTRVSEAELESNRLKELLEEEKRIVELQKVKADETLQVEAETRAKESSIRAELEKENLELKSQIALTGDEIALLQFRVSEAEEESNRVKALLDQESKRAELEKRKAKAEKKKSKARKQEIEKKIEESATLENEILKLKSEIASLHEKMGSTDQHEGNEAILLRARVTEGEAEIHRLSDLLEKERNRSDFEYNRAELEQKKAAEARKIVTSEKNKAEEERKLVIFERRRAEEFKFSLDASRAEANELREKLISEKFLIEEIRQKLEDERQIANREKKRAQSEMEKAEELKKCIEVDKMKLMDENKRSDCLSQKLEEAIQRSELLEKEIQELMTATRVKEDIPIMSGVNNNEDRNLMLLEKELKLEKLHVKHAKKVARFEKARNNLLKQELYHLKQEFFQFGYRINALNAHFSTGTEGIDVSAEMNNALKLRPSNGNEQLSGKERNPLLGKTERELVKARYTSMDGFDLSAPLSDGSGSSTKPISGIIGGSVKNKLQNSAIYSTSTSFSDRPSVGSQENNILSLSRPENFKENLKQGSVPRLSAEGTNLRINGDIGAVAENNFFTPARRDVENLCPSLDKQNGEHGSKRLKLSHGVEAVGCFSTEVRSIPRQVEERQTAIDGLILDHDTPNSTRSQIGGKLDASRDRSNPSILLDDMPARNRRVSKTGKVSLNQKQNLNLSYQADANELTDNIESEAMEHVGNFPSNVSDAMETVHSHRNGMTNDTEINHDTEVVSLEKMTGEDIMSLLELDDPDDELRFRMAMERPLSPTLPEIEIPTMEAYKLSGSTILVGTNKVDNDALSHSVDVMNVEANSDKLRRGSSDSSALQELDGSGCTIREQLDKDAGFHFQADVRNMAVQDSMNSAKKAYQNEALGIPITNGGRHECENVFKYFVVFPTIKDQNRISRIVSACETCLSDTSTASQEVWMVKKVLIALVNEKSLLPEERACVFFSALLHNLLVVTTSNYQDVLLTQMKKVISDLELRNILLGLFKLDSLLALIEGFLLDKRVMLYKDASQQLHIGYDSQNIKLQDGTSIIISSEMAGTDKLIVGSSILACICATTGHIGFVCDASYKFLLMHRSDPYLTLTVLHVFASVCGSKYFNLATHSLIMTVVMSVVTLLEVKCGSESQPGFSPCTQCVFSRCTTSVDEVLNLLLEKLQQRHQPNIDIVDVFSLVELLSYYMSWDWTWSKAIPQLLDMVEAFDSEKVSAAILLLISQLGRFGVDDGGYELQEVEELRCRLAEFLKPKDRNWSLHTQLAVVHSLIGLLPVDFADLIKDADFPPDTSKYIYANLVKAWVSQLTDEQKSLSFEILRSVDMHGH